MTVYPASFWSGFFTAIVLVVIFLLLLVLADFEE